jgi:hypothetical protein
MKIKKIAVSIVALFCVSAVAAPLASVTPDAWSEL